MEHEGTRDIKGRFRKVEWQAYSGLVVVHLERSEGGKVDILTTEAGPFFRAMDEATTDIDAWDGFEVVATVNDGNHLLGFSPAES